MCNPRMVDPKNPATGQGVEKSTILLPTKLREQFPAKLYEMLEDPRAAQSIAWLPSGLAFRILDEREFVAAAIPLYFNQTKLRSFYRQLHLWGFNRVLSPEADGNKAWCHPLFVRGAPAQMQWMRRVKIKGANKALRERPSSAPTIASAPNADSVNVVTPPCAPKPSALPNIEVYPLQQTALSALHARMGRVEERSLMATSSHVLPPPPLANDAFCRRCDEFEKSAETTVEPLPLHGEVSFDEFAHCIDDVLQMLH